VTEPAVVVDAVSKRYRLYKERNESLKAALMRGRRARYDEFWALRDVSFVVPEGSTFAIIGENGSGKSTLLKCLARILVPDEGRITTRGKIVALLELGAGFHHELTGRENVYLNGSILGLSKKQVDRRFDEIVHFSGLEKFIDSPVKLYSSGMYIRLGFAVAISVDPDILLIDEVLAVGDAEFQTKCVEKIDDLKARGKTIIIVTHALASVRNLCDQAALLEHSQLRRLGPVSEVIDEYLGDVFTDRIPDGEFGQGQRWGSGEARIEHFELLDAAGQPAKRVRTGDSVTVRLRYAAQERIDQPVFGAQLHRIDGAYVCGFNTREADFVPESLKGTGHVDLHIERLPFLPGTYDMSASVFNYSLAHAYDYRDRAFRFDVEPGRPSGGEGLVGLDVSWEIA
jgi:ABC-type polysaccharide/polyol phosphate transport system ATPase subunit